ncbi:YiiX family permuted papain-like enzyme [Oxalobacter vibrioformis]|uniref:YiiX family permuted papain-like enzyme n=1 Tax=Oxalobacter vibrioformis TaxID=933080 RepID=A0A9E9LZV4_9BURK|nr:YiiX family permuted papain-like enzyme [Oxalobacter vibrioformis]WAW10263.1 YiiX family permuted papain-like enzyme [Oxalobacter vibrioformis]
MKNILRFPAFAFLFAVFLLLHGCARSQAAPQLKEGDILFQITDSPQSRAIQLGTGSEYTHCGIVLEKDGKLQVFEAVSPVGWAPLDQWIRRGVKGHYVVMRLKDTSVLTPEVIKSMRVDTANFAGKDYDLLFQWSDLRIYCSELVWKLYKRNAKIELGPIRTFADYDLDHAAVRKIIKERYGRDFRLDEKVVAPSDIVKSDLLEVVKGG